MNCYMNCYITTHHYYPNIHKVLSKLGKFQSVYTNYKRTEFLLDMIAVFYTVDNKIM